MAQSPAQHKAWKNPPGEEIKRLLENARTVAVVGLSANHGKASYRVARYLKSKGYEIIPVNPNESEVLGEKSFPDLASIGKKIDIVDVFRKSEDTPPIVRDAIAIGAGAVWLQEGIISLESYNMAHEAGIPIVMDRCMYKEHRKLKS
jgi:predicted CoA-binding protein